MRPKTGHTAGVCGMMGIERRREGNGQRIGQFIGGGYRASRVLHIYSQRAPPPQPAMSRNRCGCMTGKARRNPSPACLHDGKMPHRAADHVAGHVCSRWPDRAKRGENNAMRGTAAAHCATDQKNRARTAIKYTSQRVRCYLSKLDFPEGLTKLNYSAWRRAFLLFLVVGQKA